MCYTAMRYQSNLQTQTQMLSDALQCTRSAVLDMGREIMHKEFAPGIARTTEGWLDFRDVARHLIDPGRKELWSAVEYQLHPAKMQTYLAETVISYVAQPGEVVLDPFGGVGTTMLAALQRCPVILLEIEQSFLDMAQAVYQDWIDRSLNPAKVMFLQGDNRQLLPIPCDHIVTSPPYAATLSTSASPGLKAKRNQKMQAGVATYTNNNLNIGRLDTFTYSVHMDKLYSKMVESVRPGGTITIVIKDQMAGGERIFHSKPCIRSLLKYGMELDRWEKWFTPKTAYTEIGEKRGAEVIRDEDIIIMRKPQ